MPIKIYGLFIFFQFHPSNVDITTLLKLLLLLFYQFCYLCNIYPQFKAAQSSISVLDVPGGQSDEKSARSSGVV